MSLYFCRHMLLLVLWIRIMQTFFWCFCASVRLVTIHFLSKNINPTLLEKFLLKWQRNYLGISCLIYWIAWKLPLPSVVYAMWVFWIWDTLLFPSFAISWMWLLGAFDVTLCIYWKTHVLNVIVAMVYTRFLVDLCFLFLRTI